MFNFCAYCNHNIVFNLKLNNKLAAKLYCLIGPLPTADMLVIHLLPGKSNIRVKMSYQQGERTKHKSQV